MTKYTAAQTTTEISITTKKRFKKITARIKYTDGEKFSTDHFKAEDFADEATTGFAVSVGADGKWQKATVSTMPSKYVFDGIHTDNGHKLVMIRVEADAIKNA